MSGNVHVVRSDSFRKRFGEGCFASSGRSRHNYERLHLPVTEISRLICSDFLVTLVGVGIRGFHF